jgi:hypothetical protein
VFASTLAAYLKKTVELCGNRILDLVFLVSVHGAGKFWPTHSTGVVAGQKCKDLVLLTSNTHADQDCLELAVVLQQLRLVKIFEQDRTSSGQSISSFGRQSRWLSPPLWSVQAGSTALGNFGGESIPYWATEDGKGRFIMSMTVLVVVAPLCLVKQLRQVGTVFFVPSFFFIRMETGSSVQIILFASYAPTMETSSA